MKQLLFACLFLFFSCKITAQSDIRIMGGAINGIYDGSNNFANAHFFTPLAFGEMDLGVSYYYNSFHQIKDKNLYFTTGSKIFYNANEQILNVSQRFGIGSRTETEGKKTTYFNIGGEFNFIGLGMYGNANILFKGKKNYFVVSPEINVIHYNMYDSYKNIDEHLLIMAGCGIAMG